MTLAQRAPSRPGKTKTGRAQPAKKVVRQEREGSDNPPDIRWHLAAQEVHDEYLNGQAAA